MTVQQEKTKQDEISLNKVLIVFPPPPYNPPYPSVVHITQEDYLRLEPGEFLNDSIIEFYMKCITVMSLSFPSHLT